MIFLKKILKWFGIFIAASFAVLVIVRAFHFYNLDKTNEQVVKIHATKLKLSDVMPNNLPPDPGAEADKTVQGIDANYNGIRDDVELAIFKEYPNSAKTRAVLLQYALALQMEFIQPIVNKETVTAVAEETSRGYSCIGDVTSRSDMKKFIEIIDRYINFIEKSQLNTEQRKKSDETINGVFTDEVGAKNNSEDLSLKLGHNYNNEPLTVDYLLNPSHIAGLGDLFDVAYQKILENVSVSDYDLTEMWNDASQKVKTKKLLLVAHSQGNFYANNLFKAITGINKVPPQSAGVYGVASPASYIVGFGSKYITSSTDQVINKIRSGGILDVLPTNVDIKLPVGDNSNGHSFSDVYLKYEGARIVSEINSSLDRLSSTSIQDENKPCIAPPNLSILHKAEGVVLAVADPVASVTKNVVVAAAVGIYNGALAIGNGVLKGVGAVTSFVSSVAKSFNKAISNIAGKNVAANVILADDQPVEVSNNISIPPADVSPPKAESDEPKKENIKLVIQLPAPISENVPIADPVTPVIKETLPPPPIQNTVPVVSNSTIPPTPTPENLYPNLLPSGGSSAASFPTPVVSTPTPTPDTTPPVISITGANPVNIEGGTTYSDAGATALDDISGVVAVSSSGVVNSAGIGTYTITYTAADSSGNTSTATRTVNVSDLTPPVITLAGNNILNILVGTPYHDLGATAIDSIDGVRTVVVDGNVDTGNAGSYEIGYTATDLSGNSARIIRTINVHALNTNFTATTSSVLNTIVVDTTWTRANSPYIISGEFQINPSRTLTIEPGVVVKFENTDSYILVNNGNLIARGTTADKIYFTSIKDDTVGGDTNSDVSATLANPGDWRGIYIAGNDPNYSSSFSNVVIRYAGSSFYPAIYVQDQVTSINDSLITDNNAIGLYQIRRASVPSTMTISGTEISNNPYGIYLNSLILNISNSIIKNNSIYGAYAAQFSALDGKNNYWGDSSGPFNATSNPGGLGNGVTDNVSISPWLTAAPF